jgi:hypothetical protein
MFLLGNKPIDRANAWCRPHIYHDQYIDLLNLEVGAVQEDPEMVRLFFDLLF